MADAQTSPGAIPGRSPPNPTTQPPAQPGTSPNIKANEHVGSPQIRSRSEQTSDLELAEPSCRRKSESPDTDEQHLLVHSPFKVIAQKLSDAPDRAGFDNDHNGGIESDCIVTDIETSERLNKELLPPELPTSTEKTG